MLAPGGLVHDRDEAMRKLRLSVGPEHWQRFPIRDVDDLRNMVLGAELEPMQLAGCRVSGGLAFSASDGMIFSSGLIEGNASVRGVPSREGMTLIIALSCGKSSRFFLHTLKDGAVIVTRPGDELCVFLGPGCLYMAVTLSLERIDRSVAAILDRTGIHPRHLGADFVGPLVKALHHIHGGTIATEGFNPGISALEAVITHIARNPLAPEITPLTSHESIVEQSLAFIEGHLTNPILIAEIARAAGASYRTLYRAFADVLGETPNTYVRRLRLHRIRRDLRSGNPEVTVLATARQWGIHEHGRMSGWYRDVFGELPSATLAGVHQRRLSETWI